MRRYFVASALALGLALSACSDAGEPSMPPSGDGARSTTAAPSDEQVIATTEAPSEDAEPTAMPTSEMEESVEGAEEFALEYLELLNETIVNPTSGVLDEWSGADCQGCDSYAANVDQMVDQELHGDVRPLTLGESRVYVTDTHYVAQVDVTYDAYTITDDNGSVVAEYEAAPQATMQLNLTWIDGSWQIEQILRDSTEE